MTQLHGSGPVPNTPKLAVILFGVEDYNIHWSQCFSIISLTPIVAVTELALEAFVQSVLSQLSYI